MARRTGKPRRARPARREPAPKLPPLAAMPAVAPLTATPASMLRNLGGFLADLGIFMQQRGGDPIPADINQERKYQAAKEDLIAELERLLERVAQDGALGAREKLHKAREIGEAIGMLRVCTADGMRRAIFAVGVLLPDRSSPWYPQARLAWVLLRLRTAKKLWDDRPPAPGEAGTARRVEFDPARNLIVVHTGGIQTDAFEVDPAKADEARRRAAELQQIYERCDYPDKAFAEAISALRPPPP